MANGNDMDVLPRADILAGPQLVDSRTIGFSFEGRPLEVLHRGSITAPVRVLLLCGQHGDERGIRRALADFVRRDLDELLKKAPMLQVCILTDANPDGAAMRSRFNNHGIDLNRDHVLLEAPETRALHRFVQSWQPHVVVDMHNFPSRREHLKSNGYQLGWDICLDYPSNPATGLGQGHPLLDELMAALQVGLARKGHCFGRYAILKPNGRARHSTPHLVDARNVLTLRYGALTLLLEARNPGVHESQRQRRQVRRAVSRACTEILHWCQRHQEALRDLVFNEVGNNRIPLRYRRPVDKRGLDVPVSTMDNRDRTTMHFARYRPHTKGRRHIRVPYGYAVPLAEHALLRVLERQGFESFLAPRGERFVVTESIYGPGTPERRGSESLLPRISSLRYDRGLEGFVVFPCNQQGGRLLSLLLEPNSVYGLHRRLVAGGELEAGTICPVRRVVGSCGPVGCDSIFEVAS